MVPRIWPGFLAIWTAIILHLIWVTLLVIPGTRAGNSTPVHEVVVLAGGELPAAAALATVALAALYGTTRSMSARSKILLVLPQQLLLGISAAGAILAMYHSHYADGVMRSGTFIVADQLAIVLAWLSHTAAVLFLVLIHQHRLTLGGLSLVPEASDRG